MASSGNFNPGHTYDAYKAVEVLDPSCTECLDKGKDCFQNFNPKSSKCHFCFVGKKACCCSGPLASKIKRVLWSKTDGPFGKELPVSEAPTPNSNSGYSNLTGSRKRDVARWKNVGGAIPVGGRPVYSSSEVPICRINNEGVVNRIKQISNSPPDPDPEVSDELDGEEVEVVHNSIGHQSSTSPSHPPAKIFQGHIIPRPPKTLQQTLATLPSSPSSSTSRPALIPAVRLTPIPQSRNFPIVTSQELQPVASSSRRREELSHFPFPATQVFQKREHWPIQVTREDLNMASKNQDAVARFLRRVDRNSRELIEYANNRTASEEMAAESSWYEDELINDFQETFDHMGRDN
ncbi:hypothetical protein O181_023103 [Austropuccinia psidii MF-1]|uniref:Uncharacterized protein n=1 Tax=Austropuccinia psidii MF-1 TaxID=1389203 RepID=A0A9Q3CI60_9BASI|nr:hypothetical protein [Austropuccinia psidii MF-1]